MKGKLESESSVESMLDKSIEKIKSLVDVNVIIGDPITSPSGSIIIPVSRIAVGFVVGGGEYSDLSERRVANHYPMAGGSASGMTVSPVGFLVETDQKISYIDVDDKSAYQSILNLVNMVMSQIKEKGNQFNEKED